MSKVFEISPTFPPNFHLSTDIQNNRMGNQENRSFFYEKKKESNIEEKRQQRKRLREERKHCQTRKENSSNPKKTETEKTFKPLYNLVSFPLNQPFKHLIWRLFKHKNNFYDTILITLQTQTIKKQYYITLQLSTQSKEWSNFMEVHWSHSDPHSPWKGVQTHNTNFNLEVSLLDFEFFISSIINDSFLKINVDIILLKLTLICFLFIFINYILGTDFYM